MRTLPAPISATTALAEIAAELVRAVLRDHPGERTISLLAISVSHLSEVCALQLELPFGLADDRRACFPARARGWRASRPTKRSTPSAPASATAR